jgi:hypothetical protein
MQPQFGRSGKELEKANHEVKHREEIIATFIARAKK